MTHQARPSRPAKYAAITTQSSVAMVSLPSGCGLRLALAPVEEEGEQQDDHKHHHPPPPPPGGGGGGDPRRPARGAGGGVVGPEGSGRPPPFSPPLRPLRGRDA